MDEFAGMVSAVARRHGLCHADVADVMQTTWLRLAENLHRLKDPSRVGAWLATTARRECLRTVRNLARELPGEESLEPAGAETPPVDERLLESERDAALWSALERLPARDQALLRMLVTEPQPSYEQVGSALGMPVGSIGPTRARALDRLRYELERGEMAA